MSSKLTRLADSMALLAARMRAEAANDSGLLREKFGGSVSEILMMRESIARQIRNGDARSPDLMRLDAALAQVANVFAALPVKAVDTPRAAQRRSSIRAMRIDASTRRILRRATLALGLTSGAGLMGISAIAIAAPVCNTVGTDTVCTGSFFPNGGIFSVATSGVVQTWTLLVQNLTADIAPVGNTPGLSLTNAGSEGSHDGAGDNGDPGGPAQNLTLRSVDTQFQIITHGPNDHGVTVQSIGGGAGNGGGGVVVSGGDGGVGGTGGNVVLENATRVTTYGDFSAGLYALSQGGLGGSGGDADAGYSAGDGAPGGNAGTVQLTNNGAIETWGESSHGIFVQSIGGNGGYGGNGGVFAQPAGSGGGANAGNTVDVINNADGAIITHGDKARGIYARSLGGYGGGGGGGAGLFGWGGDGSTGGHSDIVHVTNHAGITTEGKSADAIAAQSIGGGGGDGGSFVGLGALGSSGAAGGPGADVHVTNSGALHTKGDGARGIFAQSIGGGGGNGGDAGGLVAIGGSGSGTSASGAAYIDNTGAIVTEGARATGIFAQAVGGGGGDGGSAGGLATIGGDGGSGGAGGLAQIDNSGNITTYGTDAAGIFAQSVGGGGGNGGSATSAALFASVAIGGKGANGGDSAKASINANNTANSARADIATFGDRSAGIIAQSVGGGGGNGGYAFAGAIGPGFAATLAIGGGGGHGGAGNEARARSNGTITTHGISSNGIVAQSVGGGGGNGGFAIGVSASDGAALAFTMGGDGGSAGDGNLAEIVSWTDIVTTGDMSIGGLAESIGGGGGNGGFAVSVAAGGEFGGALGFGGKGASGGAAYNASLTNTGNVTTGGAFSHGLVAESIGGGGGNGGFAVSGAFTTGSAGLALSFGGDGGLGGSGGMATLASTGTISTSGFGASGLIAQSIGGGGGSGGFAGSLSAASGGGALSLGLGGDGHAGGVSRAVTLINTGDVTTHGDEAAAIIAQSIGGGGGNGGFSLTLAAATQSSLSVAIGGKPGQGGASDIVHLTSTGNIETFGADSFGALAQSVGGGGGNGGMAVSGSITTSGNPNASLAIGGNGGTGAAAGETHLTSIGDVLTHGAGAIGLFAQSIGGGGGSGGLAGALTLGNGNAYAKSVGGAGGSGNTAAYVELISTGNVGTLGDNAAGILAQSVGGGGGNGGASIAIAASVKGNATGRSDAGAGGTGGTALGVDVTSNGLVYTAGALSNGIIAQSIGGGGGNGGFAIGGAFSGKGSADINAVGGNGGSGNNAGIVHVNTTATAVSLLAGYSVYTEGTGATGIFAQSVGGGGGNGGFSISAGFSVEDTATNNSVGGIGGAAGNADKVFVVNIGNIATRGVNASGITAQSVGGGGGNGGFAIGAGASVKMDAKSSVGGGGAGTGGIAGSVTVTNTGSIVTQGVNATGITAQSIGGGGGNGGFAVGASFSSQGASTSSVVGGNGGAGGTADNVKVVQTGDITTSGLNATGIFAQSVGGGGGNGGFAAGLAFSVKGDASSSVGGDGAATGGVGSDGKKAEVDATGVITTLGAYANAIQAQSIGGGGGNGGFVASAAFSSQEGATNSGVGGKGGAAGNADLVTVTAHGTLATAGDSAIGIFAQSVGGGGGNGGFAVGAGLSVKGDSGSTVGGGGGGTAGDAGKVSVIDYAETLTSGANATGILAQSVGGGGGNGGFSISGGFSSEGGATSNSTGGSGGAAGNADRVDVSAYGGIHTLGLNANGITAQSVGGGGGNGGFAVGAGFSAKGDAGSTVGGGAGGVAGAGGIVSVLNASNILTEGLNAFGILAQSVGGGGGNGGFAASGAFSLEGGSSNSSVGGAGAGGGNADKVFVTNAGTINTLAANATAVLAQSVGGGGGAGAFSVGIGASKSDAASSSVGGDGGAGGDASDVAVTNKAGSKIVTLGDLAYGVQAQSIGGGGGAGGFSIGGALALEGDAKSEVGGGAGGGGGSAGLVTVSNLGTIATGGSSAIGVLAQSVGGGGGSGGFAGSIAAANGGAMSNSVGGKGGIASTGGNVIVDNQGSILALGVNSVGILAQSIGGGGGNGGFSLSGAGGRSDGASSSIGGDGGGGGNAGTVRVTNGAQAGISTLSDFSYGIQAQSIGGGGGNGGFALGAGFASDGDVDSSVGGGTGAGGGNANTVDVLNLGGIRTYGAQSIGVFAQSIGGGGGSGGFASSAGIASNGSISSSIGGKGAHGGNADKVTVDNRGSIITTGANSIGVLAQSIGGGGGSGGLSISGSGSSGGGTSTSVGGDGAGGGDGGKVTVSNSGSILTTAALSYGVTAQSVGGGGGNGGFSISGTLSNGGGITSSVGGAGSGGGAGGDVVVTNTGSIVATGAGSVGVFAQSVGGGGGSGGFAGAIRFDNGGDLGGTVGARGGAGGAGGNVTVTSTGSIETHADDSVGVLAQSVGGGGGNSAFAVSAMTGRLSSARLDLGGDATGSGGAMGTVIVNISGGTIKTLGALSYGVLAQSIGGGGGNAALSVPDPLTVGAGGVTLTVGAGGAMSGDGNMLTSASSNPVFTTGAGSAGLIAQSIGGGGGVEGNTGDIDVGNDVGTIASYVGGTSSIGGSGKQVNFTNNGNVGTSGDDAIGILTQSIGGGGGFGFHAVGVVTGTAHGIDLRAGGSQGLAGNGAAVMASYAGDVTTGERLAMGLVAQSIGGGGGVSGFVAPFGIPVGSSGVHLAAGATGGAGGDGNSVSFNANGAIATSGAGAAGIVAQSIGGGGGITGFASDGTQNPSIGSASLGGAANGAGGAVSFTAPNTVTTGGVNAVGILAQSIGGGGGFLDAAGVSLASSVTMGSTNGAGGNGGFTGITAGSVTTSGNGAHGVAAQSIGGGGGLFLSAAPGGGINSVSVNAASGGTGGNGGIVNVTAQGPIVTHGAGAYGLIAQSIGGGGGLAGAGDYTSAPSANGSFAGTLGGAGMGGAVSVLVNGDITVKGPHAGAIFAQSVGGTGNGSITIDIQSGTVQAAGDNASVRISDGANNRLSNRATITTGLGVAGLAVQTGSAADTLDNFGVLTGSVDMGAGVNTLTNRVTGTFNSGATIKLGAGNTFANAGTLSVGGLGNIAATSLTGNYSQTGDNLVDMDMRLPGATPLADRLNVSGTAAVSGTVTANILNTGYATPGTRSTVILSAADASHAGLNLVAPVSAVASFALGYPDAGTITLSQTVNFAPAGLNPNQASVGSYINMVQAVGGSDTFRPIAATLFSLQTVEQLAKAYGSMTGGPQTNGFVSATFASQRFTDQMFSCAVPGGQTRIADENACVWSRIDGRVLNVDASAGAQALDETAWGMSMGAERGIGAGWRIGGALGYEASNAKGAGNSSNGQRLQAGVVFKKAAGDWDYAAALTGGISQFNTLRRIDLPTPMFARGKQDLNFKTLSLRAGKTYDLNMGDWGMSVKPNVELIGTSVNMDAMHESGAGPLNLSMPDFSREYLRVRPGVEFGADIGTGHGWWLRPSVRLGLNQVIAGDRTFLNASFDGAPGGVAPFQTSTKTSGTLGEVTAGLEVTGASGLSVKFGYFGQYGGSTKQEGVNLKVRLPL